MPKQLLKEAQAYEMYDEALDETGEVEVGYLHFMPSQIVKELDPIAYRTGFSDFVDSISDEYEVEGY